MNENLVGGPFTRIEFRSINLNSSDQVKDYLFQHGWVPDEWNYKKDPRTGFLERDKDGNQIRTSPKFTESSFHTVRGEIPKLIARRNVLIHRKRLLDNTKKDGTESGLLHLVRSDGRISASAIPNATPTGRMAHRGVVNIPGCEAVYGKELRELFIARDGYKILGVDAAALEARIFASYIYPYKGGPELADLLINGDIHEANAKLWGCTRKEAKSPLYALLYGAQPKKLAQTMGVSLEVAEGYFNDFWDHYTALAGFRDDVVKAWKSRGGKKGGYLRGLDGRKLFARSEHSLVNLMFQSAGSIVVKVSSVFADKGIKQRNLDCKQILFIHDELEYEVREDQAEEALSVVEEAFSKGGRYFKLNVPIVGTGKIGNSWADVH